MVPVQLVGEARAVKEKIGVLLQTISEVEVEALPDRIPEYIEVDVKELAEIGEGIEVGDLKIGDFEILTDAGVTIARIAEPAMEEPVEVAPDLVEGGEAGTGEKASPESSSATTEDKDTKKKPQDK